MFSASSAKLNAREIFLSEGAGAEPGRAGGKPSPRALSSGRALDIAADVSTIRLKGVEETRADGVMAERTGGVDADRDWSIQPLSPVTVWNTLSSRRRSTPCARAWSRSHSV
jgi:hypothetical protein